MAAKHTAKTLSNRSTALLCGGTFLLVLAGTLAFFAARQLAPFGGSSLAWADADIQYLDFFAWLQAVLTGQDALDFSWGKTLGGNMVAIFSYYLSSPINLLVVFFPQEELHSFFDIAVALKLALAGAVFALFLIKRLSPTPQRAPFVVLISLCYAWSQYCVTQASNIMWLDGVYLLPLMLLGVFWVVRGKSPVLLAVAAGCSIVFNWYSGGINCFFCVFWLFFEMAQLKADNPRALTLKSFFQTGLTCAGAIVVGALLSCALFVPTIYAMQSGSRSSLEVGRLLDPSFPYSLISLVQGLTPGIQSTSSTVSLFCGSLVSFGALCCVFTAQHKRPLRLVYAAALVMLALILCWNPLITLFSLFKEVGSYWVRYAYVAIATLCYLAGVFFLGQTDAQLRQNSKKHALAIIILSLSILVLMVLACSSVSRLAITTAFLVATAGLLYGWFQASGRLRPVLSGLLALVLVAELATSAFLLYSNRYLAVNVEDYRSYVTQQQEQIAALTSADKSSYRVTQTTTRAMKPDNMTAHYNEGLAFGYASISGYTSNPDDNQRQLLDRLGYVECGENLCVTNSPLITADSLLGVKYTLSPYAIGGYTALDLPAANGKTVYQNPYALPLAYTTVSLVQVSGGEADPFAYTNALYSALTGTELTLFEPVEYTIEQTGDGWTFVFTDLPANSALYGQFSSDTVSDLLLDVNGAYATGYLKWLAPEIIYIPTGATDTTAYLHVARNTTNSGGVTGVGTTEEDLNPYSYAPLPEQMTLQRFYRLNLDALGAATQAIAANAASSISLTSNGAAFTVDNAQTGSYLVTPVSAASGWTVTVNGATVEPATIADCLYAVPLQEGSNQVVFAYSLPGWKRGLALSAVGVLCVVAMALIHRRVTRRRPTRTR